MRTKTRQYLIPVVVFILATICIIYFCKVRAIANDKANSFDLLTAEREFRANMVSELKAAGLKNPGVTMSRIITDGHNISYEISVYLPGYIQLTKQEEVNLADRLETLPINVKDACVKVNFFRKRG